MLKDLTYWTKKTNDALETRSEQNEIDFKEALSEDIGRLKEHINALGHLADGGAFVFGVAPDFSKTNLPLDQDLIISRVTNLARDCQEPPLTIEPLFLETKLGRLLCLYVYPPKTLPIFIKDRTPFGGRACFKRTGTQTVPMTIEEIRSLLASSQPVAFDEGEVDGISLDDLNLSELNATVTGFNASEKSSQRNISILIDSGILSGTIQRHKVTIAGCLMFANTPQSVRQFKNASIEFQQFKGKTRDEVIKQTTITGSLPNQIETAISLLLQHMWVLPSIVGIKREDIPSYDKPMLREIVTNAVVHRDYSKMHQPVKIAVFTDRIEVENPGALMPGLTTYNLIHKRSWRNPLLAERMKIYGFGDMDGQGIDRIFAATRKIQLPAPVFTASADSFKVTLSGPKKFEDYTPTEKRLTVLVMLILSEYIDNESVRHAFNIDLQTAGTLIKSMVGDGVIESVGKSRKFARYRLTKIYEEKIFN